MLTFDFSSNFLLEKLAG